MRPVTLFDPIAAAFRVPAKERASAWVEANLRLPASTNAVAGKLRLTSYQRQMLDVVADDAVHTAVFVLASQTGKSVTLDSFLAYTIANDPGPALLVHPSEAKATEWTRDRFDPLCAASPALRALTKSGKGNSGNGLAHKQFVGGFLAVASSHKPDDLAAKSIRYALFDEIERFATSAGREGDPVALGIKRTQMFRLNRKVIVSSTPTIKGGRIGGWFVRGDQRRFMCLCPGPGCGVVDFYRINMLRYEPGDPSTACLVCPHCKHRITERERIAAIDAGSWHATAQGEPGIVSFHASVLISPFATLAGIASDYEDAKRSPAKLKVFTNTSLAEDFEEAESEPLDAEVLAARAEKIEEPYPATVEFVSVGCDVQGNRLEATILLNMKAGVAAVAHHIVIEGDTSGNEPWFQLDGLLSRTFRTVDRRTLPVEISAIDSGFSTSRVYAFVAEQRRKSRRCFAIKGVAGFDKPITRMGSRANGNGARVVLIGVDFVKYNVLARLRMASFGPGYIHLPDHLGIEYFQGLASETLKVRQVRGYDRREFVRHERLNEALDALTYATAIASLVRAPSNVSANGKPHESVGDAAARLNAANNGAR